MMEFLSDPNFCYYLVPINIGLYFITKNPIQLWIAGFCAVLGAIANIALIAGIAA